MNNMRAGATISMLKREINEMAMATALLVAKFREEDGQQFEA
jgi:hypothetical protein